MVCRNLERAKNARSHIISTTGNDVSTIYLLIYLNRANSLNSGCLLNIRNGPQSGPPLYSKANQLIMGPNVFNVGKRCKVAHH